MTNDDGLSEKQLDDLLAEIRRSYNAPRPTPLEGMWREIERGSFRSHATTTRSRWGWRIATAAALIAGIGIGRWTSPPARAAAPAGDAGHESLAQRPASAPLYDRTTARYLGQAAALLISLPGEVRAGRTDERFVARAVELLTTTRLLIDSPSAADPKVRALLEDVELVLAQVAHLETQQARVEFELIAQALEQRDLLPRLTSAAAGTTEADD